MWSLYFSPFLFSSFSFPPCSAISKMCSRNGYDEEKSSSEEEQLVCVEDDNGGHDESSSSSSSEVDVLLNGYSQNILSLAEGGEELVLLGKIACPVLLTNLMIFSRSVISMLFLSHLGEMELAGGALALAFGNVTGFSVIKGLSMGMDPICCQAFGAKKWSVLGQTYVKTVLLLLIACIPISILWLNVEPLLEFLGQDSRIIRVASVYLVFSIPELLVQAHLSPLRAFLRSQGKTKPLTAAATCAIIFHFPISYLLVTHFKLGVRGVALSLACNTLNLNIGLVLYILFSRSSLRPWEKAAFNSVFQGWKPLLALSLPSLCSVCLEWWWYEIMMFLSGLLSNPQSYIAATGILIQTTGLLYNIPFSLSASLTTRVGHSLGAGLPSRAQWTAVIGIIVAAACSLSAFAFTVATRSVWGRMFTSEPQIINVISTAFPVLGLCELFNGPQTAACGVLSGTARPTVGARINLLAFYTIGLPVAVLLTFKFDVGYVGLWFGLAAAQGSCLCMMLYALCQTDWKQQAKRAKELALGVGDVENDLEASLVSH